MRSRLLGAVGLMALAAFATSPTRRRGLDVIDYWFTLTLPASGDTISVSAFVNFKRGPRTPDTLVLDLVGMMIDTVGVVYRDDPGSRCSFAEFAKDSARALCPSARGPSPFHYDGRVLRIPVGSRVSPTLLNLDFESVAITYHGVPQDGLIRGTNAYGHRVVFADNWPERARFWLATVDRPADKAWVTFSVQAPLSWKVVANGVESVSERLPGRWSWSTREIPIPTYTMVIGA